MTTDTTSDKGRSSRVTTLLESSATVLLIVVCLWVGGVTVWDRLHPRPAQAARATDSLPKEPLSIDGRPILGDRNAKTALILFSDFECPFCAKSAHEVLPELDRQYLRTGKVFLVWRHYPLESHRNAHKAAEAAECAGRQSRFWQFHDWAFDHQTQLDQAGLIEAASELGVDRNAFEVCLGNEATARVVSDDVALARTIPVRGTPEWFVGIVQSDSRVRVTDRLSGARPISEFKRVLDKTVAISERSATR